MTHGRWGQILFLDVKKRDLTPPPAIWNDDEVLGEPHCKTAVRWLSDEVLAGRMQSASEIQLVFARSNWVASDGRDLRAWVVQADPEGWVCDLHRHLDHLCSGVVLEDAIKRLCL
jgi:hypothetical protein